MKQTILVCDWCVGPVKPTAVGLLTLANGRGTRDALHADLCKVHLKVAWKMFHIRGGSAPPPPTSVGGASKGKQGHKRLARGQGKVFRGKVVEFAKTPRTRNEIAEHFGISKQLMSYHLQQILKTKGGLKLVGKGNMSKYVQE